MIESTKDKSLIGIIFHRVFHPILKTMEIGYAILDPAARGKGVASEAARLIVEYLFTNRTLERVEASTDVENIASQKVLEKCGFKREGTMRKARWVGGQHRDYHLYSILREDWMLGKNQPKIFT